MNTFIHWEASVKRCELEPHILLWMCLTNLMMNNKSKLQNSVCTIGSHCIKFKNIQKNAIHCIGIHT